MFFFTSISELINVWSNEAHKIIFVISVIYMPVLIALQIRNFRNISNKKEINDLKDRHFNITEIIFTLIFIIFLSGLAGIGQFMLISGIDILLRAAGVFLYTTGLFLNIYMIFRNNEDSLKMIIRYPGYLTMLLISFGMTLMTVHFFSLILSVLLMLIIFIKIKRKERKQVKSDKDYYDHIKQVPALFPKISSVFKFFKIITGSRSE